MKKILIATNVLLTSIILFHSCSNPSSKKALKHPDMETSIADDCKPQSLNINYDTVVDDGSLDAYLAQELSGSYAKDGFKGYMYGNNGIVSRANVPDTRSVWFDLARLKNLVYTIEKSVCDRNCQTPLRLGVRIYLAKYKPITGPTAPNIDMRHVPTEYANRTTVFMVGTYDNAKGMHIDFDPMNVGNNKCIPISFKRLMDSLRNKNKPLKVSGLKTTNYALWNLTDTTAMNQGDLMPPPNGAGSFPTDF
jgi:hypothetical protein